MLIMTYAHARATGDGSLISRYVCGDSNTPWQVLMDFDSIRCWLRGPTIWQIRRYSLIISKLFRQVKRLGTTDNGGLWRSSADGLYINNQTNLAIKGIIAIEAMSKMSSAAKQSADANKYSVCTRSFNTMQWHWFVYRAQLRSFITNGRALH